MADIGLDLQTVSDDTFRSIVDEAVRGHSEDPNIRSMRAKLTEPQVVDRTHLALVGMKKSVEGQLAARRADYVKERSLHRSNPTLLRESEERYQAWRAGALRFKSGVEDFMLSVRGKREKPPDNYYLAYSTLRQAITQHRATVEAAIKDGLDTESADDALWAVLDEG